MRDCRFPFLNFSNYCLELPNCSSNRLRSMLVCPELFFKSKSSSVLFFTMVYSSALSSLVCANSFFSRSLDILSFDNSALRIFNYSFEAASWLCNWETDISSFVCYSYRLLSYPSFSLSCLVILVVFSAFVSWAVSISS